MRPQIHTPTRVHSSHAKTVKRGKQCPQQVTDKQADCTHTGGDSARKRSEALTHTQPRTLKTRCSVRAAKNTRPHSERFHLCETARTGKSTETERSGGRQGLGEGESRVTTNGSGVSLGTRKEVWLEVVVAGYCDGINDVHFKMVNFILCKFHLEKATSGTSLVASG